MRKRLTVALLALSMLATGAALRADDSSAKPAAKPAPAADASSPEKQEAQIRAVEPALVVVEYTLQYDKGDAPTGGGFIDKSPLGGHGQTDDLGDIIKEERPLERPGILLDATHVLTPDVQLHPRFIKSIKVRRFARSGQSPQALSATISAYPTRQNGIVLAMEKPLDGAAAPQFDAKAAGEGTKNCSVVSLSDDEGRWLAGVQGFGGSLVLSDAMKLVDAPWGLVVDKTGTAVGVSTGVDMPADETWKGSPLAWPVIPAEEMQKMLATLDARATRAIVRVMLNFRSPKNLSAEQIYQRGSNDPGATVQYVLGVLTNDQTLLVLADLKPTVTARLERIKAFTNPPTEATFKASLADYGAFVATLDKPLAGAGIGLSATDLPSVKAAALTSAEIFLQGDQRVSYLQPRRIAGFTIGWRRHVYPEIAGETRGLFLFDAAGAMLAMPILHREKVSIEGRYSGQGQPQGLVTPVAQVAAALADLQAGGGSGGSADPGNVPLTEDQENRVAWLGFEMQPMNPELARANGVADQTNDGENGALVTFVHPGSPAATAGVEAGWVLLRFTAPGQPKPIDVRVATERFAEQPFPWDQLATAPEAYFDRILELSPWPRAENAMVRTITDLGFGSKYSAEFFHDGKVDKKDFTVVEGPANFNSAPKYKQPALGLTVKDLTYEVRRYMQKKPDDPGVIIGKIEMGSRASKAGLKPYEVITHVNDQPVMNVHDFEKLTKDQQEVRLNVKRMTQGRIVKVKLADEAGTQPAASAPAAREPAGNAPPAGPGTP